MMPLSLLSSPLTTTSWWQSQQYSTEYIQRCWIACTWASVCFLNNQSLADRACWAAVTDSRSVSLTDNSSFSTPCGSRQCNIHHHTMTLAHTTDHQSVYVVNANHSPSHSYQRHIPSAVLYMTDINKAPEKLLTQTADLNQHSSNISHWKYYHSCLTHTQTIILHKHTTVLRLYGFCPGQPGWASTRRNIHPLTPIVVINHPYLVQYKYNH